MEKINVEGIIYTKIKDEDIIKTLPSELCDFNFKWVTGHWTAGRYDQPFNHYQLLIGNDYILIANKLTQSDPRVHSHTWRRNTSNFGFSFMAMLNANFPITPKMIEIASKTLAILKKKYNLNWDQFKDHNYWAEIDGYKGLRWDINIIYKDDEAKKIGKAQESLLERLIRKGNWYLSKI
jgi:hypothetical protein